MTEVISRRYLFFYVLAPEGTSLLAGDASGDAGRLAKGRRTQSPNC